MTTEPRLRSARLTIGVSTMLAALMFAGCAGGSPAATPGGSAEPTTTPSPTASADVGIQHPTGAKDIVLRMAVGGGFVPIDAIATSAPTFTLYGDGTVVVRDPTATPPEAIGNVYRLSPFLTIRLDEAGIQALLDEAIGRGGLGIAVGPYVGQGADIPSTTFTITAGGRTKEVTVVGLSPDMHPQNVGIVTALARLAERLERFASVVGGAKVYAPVGYRGVLMPIDQPFGPVVAWPWPDVDPTDFVSGDNEFFKLRTLSPAEVAEVGVPGMEGGFQGLILQQADQLYSFALRPLLPDETK